MKRTMYFSNIPDPDGGQANVPHQVWDITLGHHVVRSITSSGRGRSFVRRATWRGRGG